MLLILFKKRLNVSINVKDVNMVYSLFATIHIVHHFWVFHFVVTQNISRYAFYKFVLIVHIHLVYPLYCIVIEVLLSIKWVELLLVFVDSFNVL